MVVTILQKKKDSIDGVVSFLEDIRIYLSLFYYVCEVEFFFV